MGHLRPWLTSFCYVTLQVAIYGMSQSIPDRSIVSELACGFLDCMYTIGNAPPAHENGLLKNWSRVCHNWIVLMSQLVLERSISGGNFHIKSTGMLEGSFEINPYDLPRSCLVGVAWSVFYLEDIPFPKYEIIYSHIFSAQCLKRYWKSARCGPRAAERRKETAFFNPKRHGEHPFRLFYGIPLRSQFWVYGQLESE